MAGSRRLSLVRPWTSSPNTCCWDCGSTGWWTASWTRTPATRRCGQQVADEPAPDPRELSRRARSSSARGAGHRPVDRRQGGVPHRPPRRAGRRRAAAWRARRCRSSTRWPATSRCASTRWTPTSTPQAHDEISGLLGGSGPLADRFAADARGRAVPAGAGRARGPHRRRGAATSWSSGPPGSPGCPRRSLRDRHGRALERLQLLPRRLHLPGRRERRTSGTG